MSSVRRPVTGSIRVRLAAAVMTLTAVSLLAGGWLLVNFVEVTLVSQIQARNDVVLDAISDVLDDGDGAATAGNGTLSTARLTAAVTARLGDAAETTTSRNDTWFFIEGRSGTGNSGRITVLSADTAVPDTDDELTATRTVNTRWGVLTIGSVTTRESVEEAVTALRNVGWVSLPLIVAFAGGLGWVIAARSLAPVGAMTAKVRELGAGNLSARVPVPDSHDEIAELAVTMNAMLGRLEDASERQQQFISDASHELKSPVASIRTQLETARRYPDGVDWDDVSGVVLAEGARLEHLINNLLALARLDEGYAAEASDVDIDDIVWSQPGGDNAITIDRSAVNAGRVIGDRQQLTSVVRNLVDNAIRHANETVAIAVNTDGDVVLLTVDDDGAGIAAERRDVIFERFARLQESRDRDSGGCGIGLALTKRIVEGHHGTVAVSDSDLGGARFTVTLPAAP